jgi:GAF domain-containing protein
MGDAMKRRSRTLDKPAGPGRPKTPKSKGSGRQIGASSRNSSTPTAEEEIARLTRELNEAWEQQAATSEVLQVISNSPDELQPVFDGMLANATRLCGASYGTLWLRENDAQMRMVALHGTLPEAFRETWRVGALHRPNPSVPTARAFAAHQPVHIVDLGEDQSYLKRDQLAVASVEVAGIRSLVCMPMLKEGAVVGAMNIYRQEVRPFTDKQIRPAALGGVEARE